MSEPISPEPLFAQSVSSGPLLAELPAQKPPFASASNHELSAATILQHWQPPLGALAIQTLDCHTGGEPLRIITTGFAPLEGSTVLAQRADCVQQHDALRQLLMFEPRGHADMYGCVLTAPERPDSAFGVIFLHNEGYSTMCGHAMIALAKVAVESGAVAVTLPVSQFQVDAPCGQVTLYAQVQQTEAGYRVDDSWFDNVPSFADGTPRQVEVAGLGTVTYQLAYGGAYYAYVDANSIGLSLAAENHQAIIAFGRRIKQQVAEQHLILHPTAADLSFLYGVIFTGPAHNNADMRNVCVFADGELDRSPTGSGVSGLAAILYRDGNWPASNQLRVESITGAVFSISIKQQIQLGTIDAVIPQVRGQAFVSGRHQFFLDPQDPFPQGFIFR
ncbi:MAG: proline racemase [Rheinheimera sp.]|nr:MAG: proline racemase [Rheinheimera sp.]